MTRFLCAVGCAAPVVLVLAAGLIACAVAVYLAWGLATGASSIRP